MFNKVVLKKKKNKKTKTKLKVGKNDSLFQDGDPQNPYPISRHAHTYTYPIYGSFTFPRASFLQPFQDSIKEKLNVRGNLKVSYSRY